MTYPNLGHQFIEVQVQFVLHKVLITDDNHFVFSMTSCLGFPSGLFMIEDGNRSHGCFDGALIKHCDLDSSKIFSTISILTLNESIFYQFFVLAL